MTSFIWLSEEVILAVHDRLLALHGGLSGIRDRRLLESALARPRNLAAYATPDVFGLAAAYASGIVGNHPFVDGNKRTGLMAAYIFLDRNGWRLQASEAEATQVFLGLGSGEISSEQLAVWLAENCLRTET